jgi:cobaltochelatase CobS
MDVKTVPPGMPARKACRARWSATCPGCGKPYGKGDALVGLIKRGIRKPWVYAYYHEGCAPEALPDALGPVVSSNEIPEPSGNGTEPAQTEPSPSTRAPAGSLESIVAGIAARVAEERFTALAETLPRAGASGITVTLPDGEVIREIPDETAHPALREVLELVSARINVLLVGPAGCGKTHLAGQVARSLGREFASISCSAGMSEGQVLGRLLPVDVGGRFVYVRADFVRLYEEGGVFLLDELDAADANTLLVLNAALANGHLWLPNRPEAPRAARHQDNVILASANTFGTGADRMYVGRSQLDESTLDRFRMGTVEIDYDAGVEEALCPDAGLRGAILDVRARARAAKLRRVVSTRFLADAYKVKQTAGWSDDRILAKLTAGWSPDEKRAVGREGV